MINLLIKLSENDKRLIFAILLIVILVFVIIGYIGMWITKVMKWQGKRIDNLCHDVVITRVITDKKHFIRYARKKSWRLFYKQSRIPFLLMLAAALLLIIRNAVCRDWSYNVFDYKETGFSTILFVWDFSHVFTPQNGTLVVSWPELVNTPHLEGAAWVSYIFIPFMLVGGIWYLVSLQALIARTIQLYSRSNSIFDKSLEGYNQNKQMAQAFNPMNNQTNNPNNNQQ